jgi:hypothetical protein
MVQQHDHFVLQHVWKTGGTEMCSLAKLNGWHVPDSSGCNVHTVTKTSGWPNEDYQMIGNEKMVLSNPFPRDFVPQNADGIQVHGVKWMTILRHPFSRSLSHYYHAHQYKNYTMQQFIQPPLLGVSWTSPSTFLTSKHGGSVAVSVTQQDPLGSGRCAMPWPI